LAFIATRLQQGTRKGALCVLLACAALGSAAAERQEAVPLPDAMAEFPPGSIGSTARAEAALRLVDRERVVQESRYAQARKRCYDKFMAEQCLGEARLENIRVTERIREVELEARSVKRVEELRELDQAREARNRDAMADAERKRAQAERKQAERDERAAERLRKDGPEEAARRAARAREVKERAAARAEARVLKDKEASEGAAARAERARQHEESVRETLERAERRARAEEKKAAERGAAAAQAAPGR